MKNYYDCRKQMKMELLLLKNLELGTYYIQRSENIEGIYANDYIYEVKVTSKWRFTNN